MGRGNGPAPTAPEARLRCFAASLRDQRSASNLTISRRQARLLDTDTFEIDQAFVEEWGATEASVAVTIADAQVNAFPDLTLRDILTFQDYAIHASFEINTTCDDGSRPGVYFYGGNITDLALSIDTFHEIQIGIEGTAIHRLQISEWTPLIGDTYWRSIQLYGSLNLHRLTSRLNACLRIYGMAAFPGSSITFTKADLAAVDAIEFVNCDLRACAISAGSVTGTGTMFGLIFTTCQLTPAQLTDLTAAGAVVRLSDR
jgi:hypothetical protein